MVGLKFEIQNAYGQQLKEIFHGINVEQYWWHVNQDDIIDRNSADETSGIFPGGFIDGYTFRACIEKESYYILFADLKAYGSEEEPIVIKTFDDYLKSSCKIMLFIADCAFVYAFSKDESILKAMIQNCTTYHFQDLSCMSLEDAVKIRLY